MINSFCGGTGRGGSLFRRVVLGGGLVEVESIESGDELLGVGGGGIQGAGGFGDGLVGFGRSRRRGCVEGDGVLLWGVQFGGRQLRFARRLGCGRWSHRPG